jgi:hypothetical protein
VTRLGGIARWALAGLGALAIVLLVREAGAANVVAAVGGGWPWLAAVAALEVALALADVAALRSVLGDRARGVPLRAWARGAMLAYAAAAFLPAGRVAGEVARAATLSRWIGAPRAAAAASLLQGSYVAAVAAASLLCAASLGATALGGLALANAAMAATVAAVLVAGPRAAAGVAQVVPLAGAVLARFAPGDTVAGLPAVPVRAIGIALAGRAIHLAQCGALLAAVGAGCERAIAAAAIQLVAGNAGDLVPGRVGVVEAAYRVVAADVGLAGAASRAVALALLLRIAQLGIAAVCAAVCAARRAE